MEQEDLKLICDEGPNIVVLMICENNIFLDTDPRRQVGHTVSLTTMMSNKGYTKEVVICKLLPFLHKMNGHKKDWTSQYLESY